MCAMKKMKLLPLQRGCQTVFCVLPAVVGLWSLVLGLLVFGYCEFRAEHFAMIQNHAIQIRIRYDEK